MNQVHIVPVPLSIKEGQGNFLMTPEMTIILSSGASALTMIPAPEIMGSKKKILQQENCNALSQLIDIWLAPLRDKYALPMNLAAEKKDKNQISLEIDQAVEDPEYYKLEISEKKVTLTAGAAPGLFYGLQSILQMGSSSGRLPLCSIEDKPRFLWRGLHLDCGRFFQPLDEIKRFLDTMALQKMNVFHWHLTEDQGWRLEIKKYPALTEHGSVRKETGWGHYIYKKGKYSDAVAHGGFYSQDEVREIVSYARNRGIMVVPEIDLPGHSRAAISAYPELGVFGKKMDVFTRWGVCEDIYNPEESTISFLEDVLTEVMELFPSPWIHIGGDEAVKKQWKKSERVKELLKERGLKNNHEMQSWFIKKIAAFLQSRGRKTIGWDEIMEGGAPEGAVIMAWRHEKKGIEAAEKGLPVLMCPCQWTYLDYRESRGSFEPVSISTGYSLLKYNSLEHFYSWNPLPHGLGQNSNLIMGGQGQVWTEYMPGPSMLQYMTWPRASALAEVLWSPGEKRNFPEFEKRLSSVLSLLDRNGTVYRFRENHKKGGSLQATGNKWQEQSLTIDEDRECKRIQLLFKRQGRASYSEIAEVRVECGDSRIYTDCHKGYAGDFNRLNVFTLGDGRPMDLKNCRIIVKSRACARVPGDKKEKIRESSLQWAYRLV